MTNKDITKENIRKVKDLLREVKELTPEQFKKILDGLAMFRQYSLYNQIILCFAGCSQVAGYKKWKELNRTVKKGEKAVWILAPWFKKINKEKEEDQEKEVLHGFFSVPVFDLTLPTAKAGGFSDHRRSHLLLPEGPARASLVLSLLDGKSFTR